jgi:hypothetical protein
MYGFARLRDRWFAAPPHATASFASIRGCPSVIEKGSSSPGPLPGSFISPAEVHDGGRTVSIAAIIAFAATTEFASDRVARLPDELIECGDRLRVGYQTQNRAVAV